MIHPADLAACCPAAAEPRTPALARARAARSSGQLRACRVALTAHLLLRRVADIPLRVQGSDTLQRLRQGLELPGGPGEEAHHLLRIVDALDQRNESGALRLALTAYAVHLEHEGHFAEALLVINQLLIGLPAFASQQEAGDLALLVGRLDVTLAHWGPAARALDMAEVTAMATGRGGRLRLVQLVRATAWAAQGRLTAARALIETIVGRTDDDAPADQLADAWCALGAALESQGLLLEALQAHYQALQHAADGAPRRRSLADLGGLLRGLGAGAAARQAFTLALAGPIPFGDQVAARLELLDLAAALGDRVAFERQRRELAAWQERMPAGAAVEFLTRAAAGLASFGQPGRATRLLEEALALAERHELHEAWFRIERQLFSRSGAEPQSDGPAEGSRSVIPLPWEYPEIAEVAEALERQAATMVVQG